MLTGQNRKVAPVCAVVAVLALLAIAARASAAIQPQESARPGAGRAPAASALPVQWEELTASDFPEAVERADRVCMVPLGVVEKHGPHLPLATDVMIARASAIRAAEREYAVVFPYYFFGQINLAKHQPGCIAIDPDLLSRLLQSVCDEIARNGFNKILLVNAHGGNTNWLAFFCQIQLATRRDYAVYIAGGNTPEEIRNQIQARKRAESDGHAGEFETSCILALRPDLVKLDRAGDEDWRRLERLDDLGDTSTGIRWYANYPNHYAGDATVASVELGELALEGRVQSLVGVLRAVKRDNVTLRLQDEFHDRSAEPLQPFPE